MKKLIITILMACLAVLGLVAPVQAEEPTMDEALIVANNWITLIIQEKGDWGGAKTAQVAEIQEFKRGQRTLGYFCRVEPQGFIVISLRKELAPVKAYSAVSNLDPEFDEGMADLIKGGMERVLNAIERQAGPMESVQTADLENIVEINYRQAWQELAGNVQDFKEGLEGINYQEGQVLLSTEWHQHPPYNDDCPWLNCNNSNGRAVVGCVATAGAQIMRYWHWPPYGVGIPYSDAYDWPNILDIVGTSSPQVQINAVAELNHEVGQAVGMDYGCGGSYANTYDMEDVYEDHYRYSTASTRRDRDDYGAVEWFNRMKAQFNLNRPVQYRVIGHSIVSDGWQEIGSIPIRQYHMNYGWANSYNAWYTLDALYLGHPDREYMLENIYPAQALGPFLSGTYTRQSFPYRYFDQDATGHNVIFESGQRLQFLPNIKVSPAGATDYIYFYGSTTNNTYLFTRGDLSRGIRIYNGSLKMTDNGSGIKFY